MDRTKSKQNLLLKNFFRPINKNHRFFHIIRLKETLGESACFVLRLEMSLDINSKDFVASLKGGSETAFTELHNHYNLSLCSYAYRILNDNNEARETVHITFCKIWDNRKSIDITESLNSYLYKGATPVILTPCQFFFGNECVMFFVSLVHPFT